MPLKLLCNISKSITKQIKFTELVYHKHSPTKVPFSEYVYFVQICPTQSQKMIVFTKHHEEVLTIMRDCLFDIMLVYYGTNG